MPSQTIFLSVWMQILGEGATAYSSHVGSNSSSRGMKAAAGSLSGGGRQQARSKASGAAQAATGLSAARGSSIAAHPGAKQAGVQQRQGQGQGQMQQQQQALQPLTTDVGGLSLASLIMQVRGLAAGHAGGQCNQ